MAKELENGIPLFLTQLIGMLQTRTPAYETAMGESATRHGDDMLRMGFTVGQVVHDDGGLCHARDLRARAASSPSDLPRQSSLTPSGAR